MKKKIGYAIIISCIFLISGSTCNTFAYNVKTNPKGYRFGTPDYAKGIRLDMEVKEFDRDEWRDHIGYVAEPDELFGGTEYDADVEGAKLRSKILDWERKENDIPFFSDFVLTADQEIEDIPTAENLLDVIDYVDDSIHELAPPVSEILTAEKPLVTLVSAVTQNVVADPAHPLFINATIANNSCNEYGFNNTYVNSIYNKNLDGWNLHRDLWWWTSKDFKKYPDVHRFDVPFIKDPEDWANTYDLLAAFKTEFLGDVQYVVDSLLNLNESLNLFRMTNYTEWLSINSTLALLLSFKYPLPTIHEGSYSMPWIIIDACINPTGYSYLQNLAGNQKGLLAIAEQLADQIPGKFGFLWQLLLEGLPVCTPVDGYLEDVVDAFDINGRAVETGIKGLDPTTQIIGDVWAKENTIVLEFKYADPNEERDGWKVEFTYDDYGIQESVVFLGSEPFYEQELLPSSLEQRIVSSL
ncbi:MAG: hypothetical protein ACFFAS_20830, partial [Promethearchaeota archaeon]